MDSIAVIEYLQDRLIELEERGELILQNALHDGASADEVATLQEDIELCIKSMKATIEYLED